MSTSLEPSSTAPQVVAIYDDVDPGVGYQATGAPQGLFTNDATPTIQVSLIGSGAAAGQKIQLTLAFGATLVGTPYVLTAEDIAAGFALITPGPMADGQYPLVANLLGADGQILQTGFPMPVNVVTQTPAAPSIVALYDDSAGGPWKTVAGTTGDSTPIVRVFVPGVSEQQSPSSPGHPPFGDPSPLHGGRVDLYIDGVLAASATIGTYGYVDFPAPPLNDGDHAVSVVVVDKAGNASAPSGAIEFTVGFPGQILIGTDVGEDLVGGEGDDHIEGRGGNDAIAGGAGVDILIGGLGDDWYYVKDQDDLIIEAPGAGWDNVWAETDFILPDNVENLYLAGGGAFNGTGNDLGNQIIGNYADNIITGLGGDDALRGGDGLDTFVFGPGDGHDLIADFVSGEDQIDLRGFGGAPFDIVAIAGGFLIGFEAGESITVMTAGQSLEVGVDIVVPEAGNEPPNLIVGTDIGEEIVGKEADDRIEGRGGNDAMAGGAGHDVLAGGLGDDWYYLNDNSDDIEENAGEGWDNIYSTVSITAAANVENVYLAGDGAIDATGNELGNQLVGNSAANVLTGRGGDDALRGGGGSDRFVLGAGDGHDIIVDFVVGEDLLEFDGSYSVSQIGADALVTLGGGESVLLLGVPASSLVGSIDIAA